MVRKRAWDAVLERTRQGGRRWRGESTSRRNKRGEKEEELSKGMEGRAWRKRQRE